MANWKHYMGNGFVACRLLAYARDNHRNRDVRIYLIPGEWESVGVTDGVDSWIAPVIADPFSVSVKRLIEDLLAGKEIPKPEAPATRRHRVRILEANIEQAAELKKVIRRKLIL